MSQQEGSYDRRGGWKEYMTALLGIYELETELELVGIKHLVHTWVRHWYQTSLEVKGHAGCTKHVVRHRQNSFGYARQGSFDMMGGQMGQHTQQKLGCKWVWWYQCCSLVHWPTATTNKTISTSLLQICPPPRAMGSSGGHRRMDDNESNSLDSESFLA